MSFRSERENAIKDNSSVALRQKLSISSLVTFSIDDKN